MECKFCRAEIYGGKGDYWHTGTDNMRCRDGESLAYPVEVEQWREERVRRVESAKAAWPWWKRVLARF